MGYLEEFQTALENRDAPKLLRLWEEYTHLDPIDGPEFKEILQAIKESDLSDYVGRHIERILSVWEKLEEGEIKYQTLTLIIDIQETNSDQLRNLAIHYLETKHQGDEKYQQKMRMIGLRTSSGNFKGAMSNFELLTHMQKGNFVFHMGGWGVGEIMDVSFVREELGVEFEYFPGQKDIAFKTCFSSLVPLQKDHFLALRFGHPEALEELAKKDPVELIRRLLKDLGSKTAAEIKDELFELIIPAAEWNRWWQGVRAKVKKDTFIESPEDLKQPFKLLKLEISHEARLHKFLENRPDVLSLIQMVHTFMKDFPETLKNQKFKSTLESKLIEMAEYPELSNGQKLELNFFLQDLRGERESQAIRSILNQVENEMKPFLEEISIPAFKKRALIELRKTKENWPATFLDLLLDADQNFLRDYILNELLDHPESKAALHEKLSYLSAYPTKHPETAIWYFQKILTDKELPLGDVDGKSRFFEAFFVLLNYLEQTGSHRELMKKMYNLLTANRYSIVRAIMKEASVKDVQECLLLATKCHTLSDQDIKILHSLAEVAHPSLAKKIKKVKEEDEEDLVIWTTRDGFQKLQKRLEQIATVETVENAKEIEVARSHGDLRENAEFDAALRKRDQLQAELKFLSQQLKRARILTSEDVFLDRVGVGVVVECVKKDGSKVSYTLLGPWDANLDLGIISYQSKLAKTMTGLKVGDHFKAQDEELTISEIRPAVI